MPSIHRFLPAGFEPRRLFPALENRGLQALLLTSPEDVFYTTGYTALASSGNPILYMLRNRLPSFSFIDSGARVSLLCWGFSAQGVEFGADQTIGYNNFAGALDSLRAVMGACRERDGGLGITSSCPYFVLKIAEACGLSDRLVLADDLMEGLRLIKSSEEIARLRKSTELMEAACRELFGLLRVGMGRSELCREAKSRLIQKGATGISHITLSFTQANPEVDIDEPLEEGKLVTIDIGGIYHGYCSDTRRYAYTGAVPESLGERYRRMVEIVDKVGEALVPGRTYRELFQLAIDQYARQGIKPLARFNHVGHNIGLETEEQWLDDSPDRRIQSGMVINIELYSTAETGEQIGDEETYVIDATGPNRVSQLPREIQQID
ncbi:MAG: M24 family metallopeptidase [Terriglobia bacterium]